MVTVHREDGRVEVLCHHGVGHPSSALTVLKIPWRDWMGIHGCDGCCVGEQWMVNEAEALKSASGKEQKLITIKIVS